MLHAKLIPQADRLERVGEFVLLTGLGSTVLRDILFVGRDRQYYAAAAASLGLVEDGDEVSDAGASLAERPAAVMHTLATALERSSVGRAWSEWAGIPFAELDGASAEAFLEAASELSTLTAARRARTLRNWLDAARPFLESTILPPDPSWQTLQQLVPDAVREVAPDRVPEIPTRVLTHCTRHHLVTLGDLLQWSEEDLGQSQGMGAKSLRDLRHALKRFVESYAPEDGSVGGDDLESTDFISALEELIVRLGEREQAVLRRRLGLGAPSGTLDEIAGDQGVSRERIRQIESSAFDELGRQSRFQEVFHQKIAEALAERGAAEYGQLGEFWPAQAEASFRMVFKYLGPADAVLESWRDSLVLRRRETPSIEADFQAMESWLKAQPLPLPVAYLDLELAPKVRDEGVRELIRDRLFEQWNVVSTTPEPMIIARGSTRRARILEHLLRSPAGVPIKEIEELFGRGALPDEAVYIRRGLATLPDHLPGFEEWAKRLAVPLAAYVTAEGADREWMARTLLEYAKSIAKLPEWITPMLLAHMLERSGQFDSLGRQRLTLAGAKVAERTHLLPKLTELVEAAGAPVEDTSLHEQLKQHVEVLEQTYVLLRTTPPLFRLDDGRIGLMPRDLPGGADAADVVVRSLVRKISEAQQKVRFDDALVGVQALGGVYTQWSIGHIRGVARASDALRPTRSAIGVREVEESEPVESSVEDDGEPPSVEPPAPEPTAHTESQSEPSGSPARLPSARDLSLPRDARNLYTRLTLEPPEDLDALAGRVQAHAEEFEDASRRSEFLPVAEARALGVAYPKLLARAREEGSRPFLALAWVVGRYFEISDDGTLDFSIGGLDDDVAVFNAVARYMDAADLEIEQEF